MKKWEKLYHAVNRMMAVMGAEGEVNTQMAVADDVMGALAEIDGGVYKESFTISAPTCETCEHWNSGIEGCEHPLTQGKYFKGKENMTAFVVECGPDFGCIHHSAHT